MITRKELENMVGFNDTTYEEQYTKILNLLDDYNSMGQSVSALDKYNKLVELSSAIKEFMVANPTSPRVVGLKRFGTELGVELGVLLTEYDEKEIPKNLNFIWIGGEPGNAEIDYVDVWKKVNKDYEVKFWFDSEALLINYLKKTVFQKCSGETIEEMKKTNGGNFNLDDEREFLFERSDRIFAVKREFEETVKAERDKNPKVSIEELIKKFLVEKYSIQTTEMDALVTRAKQKFTENNGSDVRENLDVFKNKEDFTLYERELLFQWNMAAASDILRLVILDSTGGVYIDVDTLPGIREDLFEGVNFSTFMGGLSEEAAKLEAIMKEKKYIRDYEDGEYNKLPQSEKNKMIEILKKQSNITDIFNPLGEIKLSDIGLRLKVSVFMFGFFNSVFMSTNKSYLIGKILEQIRLRYSILDEALNPLLEDKNKPMLTIIEEFSDKIDEMEDPIKSEFLSKVVSYLALGSIPGRIDTLSLSGPDVINSVIKDFISLSGEMNLDPNIVLSSGVQNTFGIRNDEASIATQAERKSGWILKKNESKEEFRKYVVEAGGKLSSHEGTNFNENKLVDKDGLTQTIKELREKPSYEKDYLHFIVQLQGDKTSYDAATALFAKFAENAVLVQSHKDSILNVFDIDTKTVKEISYSQLPENLKKHSKLKLTLVGHGESQFQAEHFAGKDVRSLLYYLFDMVGSLWGKVDLNEIEINLLGCNMFSDSVKLSENFGGKLLEHIIKDGQLFKLFNLQSKSSICVSSSEYAVRINSNGTKEILTDDGRWINKEEALLEELTTKRTIVFDEDINEFRLKSLKMDVLKDLYTYLDKNTNIKNKKTLMIETLKHINDNLFRQYKNLDKEQLHKDIQRLIKNIKLSEEISMLLKSIYEKNNISKDFVLIMDDIRKVGEKYNVTLVNKINGKKSNITIENKVFEEYAKFIKSEIETIKNGIVLSSPGEYVYKFDIENSTHISSMTSAFLFQYLLDYFSNKQEYENLNNALKVQFYTQISSLTISAINEASQLVSIIKDALGKTNSIIPRFVGDVAGAVGVILDGINLGAAIYELVNTTEELHKEMVAGKVGIFAVNFTTSLSSILASLAGSAVAAEILGAIAVPVAGISVGLPTLVNNILILKHNSQETIKYFGNFLKARKQGFVTKPSKGVAYFYDSIPIKKVDFKNNKINIGKVDIIPLVGGSGLTFTGGLAHYFSAPYPDYNGKPLSITDACLKQVNSVNLSDTNVLILPNGADRLYRYDMEFVPGVRYMTGDGVTILNEIRSHYGNVFNWRFYAVPGDQSFRNLKPLYYSTEVEIVTNNKDMTFIAPIISSEQIRKCITHKIIASQECNYTYVCQKQPTKLKIDFKNTDGSNAKACKWFIQIDNLVYSSKSKNSEMYDSSLINNFMQELKINANKITLKGQEIQLLNYKKSEIYLVFSYFKNINIIIKLNMLNKKIEDIFVDCTISDALDHRNSIISLISNSGASKCNINEFKYYYQIDDDTRFSGYFLKNQGTFAYTRLLKDLNAELGDETQICIYNTSGVTTKYLYGKNIRLLRKDKMYYLTGDFYYNRDVSEENKNSFVIELKNGGMNFNGISLCPKLISSFVTSVVNGNSSFENFMLDNGFKNVFRKETPSIKRGTVISGSYNNKSFEFIYDNKQNPQLYSFETSVEKEKESTLYTFNLLESSEMIVTQKNVFMKKLLVDTMSLDIDTFAEVKQFIRDLLIMPTKNVKNINLKGMNKIVSSNIKSICISPLNSFYSDELCINVGGNIEDFEIQFKGSDLVLKYNNENLDKDNCEIVILNAFNKLEDNTKYKIKFDNTEYKEIRDFII